MKYSTLSNTYQKIESTTKRLEMTDYLVELFKDTNSQVIDKIVYLTQGKLYPDFVGIELGIAEKLALKAIYEATGIKEEKIEKSWIKEGDLGIVAEDMIANKKQTALFSFPLTVERVYENFEKIAKAKGSGSQDLKLKLLAELLHDSKPLDAKYILRTVSGKLRLGIADMTIIDALAISFATKEEREEIVRGYNICSDLGAVAKALAIEGIESVRNFKVKVGVPLRAMLAERLTTIPEIFEKLDGECAFEYKYDGLRIQAHIGKQTLNHKKIYKNENKPDCQFLHKIKLFSRKLEDLTPQFPDITKALREAFGDIETIVEGECVPINIHTNELLPFQEVSHRRGRKYGISDAVFEYPVLFYLFDCLYDGKDLTSKPFLERRERLKEMVKETKKIKISKILVSSNNKEAEKFFNEAIEYGCEGLIAKSIKEDSFYRAGSRGWQWIKYKREYKSEMNDTIDLVVVGAFAGRGRRKGNYGALLMAAYNNKKDCFETVCKLGTGFDDETLDKIPKLLNPYLIEHPHPRVRSELKADFWFVPEIVMEILGAEITLSPNHSCGWGEIKENTGFSIRFPRFTNRWRDDKKAEDATSVKELIELYERQLKKL